MNLSNAIVDLLFPKKCIGCMTLGVFLCKKCSKKLPIIDVDRCPHCQRSSFLGFTHPMCKKRFGLDGAKSIFRYDGLVKKITTNIKYKRVKKALFDLVQSIPQEKRNEFAVYKNILFDPVLIPVPLHPRRERQRGFNQSDEIAKTISYLYNIPINKTLVRRIKNTLPQARLKNAAERRENIRGAFSIDPTKLALYSKKTTFIIVDDVWTTGATIKEIGKEFKKLRSLCIYGLTLCVTR